MFKRRAAELEKLVTASFPDATFSINPDKPRRGCFEVRSGDKVFVSLQVHSACCGCCCCCVGGMNSRPPTHLAARDPPKADTQPMPLALLQSLPRPFTKLRELDLEAVASDVVAGLSS